MRRASGHWITAQAAMLRYRETVLCCLSCGKTEGQECAGQEMSAEGVARREALLPGGELWVARRAFRKQQTDLKYLPPLSDLPRRVGVVPLAQSKASPSLRDDSASPLLLYRTPQ